jgi:hypothetical protein
MNPTQKKARFRWQKRQIAQWISKRLAGAWITIGKGGAFLKPPPQRHKMNPRRKKGVLDDKKEGAARN